MLSALEAWKPGVKTAAKDSTSSSTMKSILGDNSPLDEEEGRRMAMDARQLAREGLLGNAAAADDKPQQNIVAVHPNMADGDRKHHYHDALEKRKSSHIRHSHISYIAIPILHKRT